MNFRFPTTLLALLCSAVTAQDQSLLELVNGTTLADAVGLADLTDALSGDGPFTVLAPSDEALAGIPGKLLDPMYKFHLQGTLLFHVLSGTVTSDMLTDGMTAPTLYNEETITASVSDAGVAFGPAALEADGLAMVTTADVAATNGVAHLIDGVLTPSFLTSSIADVAIAAGSFTKLLEAATAAGLAGALQTEGNFTVLAPTDDAFNAVENLDAILADVPLLLQILQLHVIPTVVHSSTLMASGSAPTLLPDVPLSYTSDAMTGVAFTGPQNEAKVTAADILASNGIVHVIDTVLLPPSMDMTATTDSPTVAPQDDSTSAAASSMLASAGAAGILALVVASL